MSPINMFAAGVSAVSMLVCLHGKSPWLALINAALMALNLYFGLGG